MGISDDDIRTSTTGGAGPTGGDAPADGGPAEQFERTPSDPSGHDDGADAKLDVKANQAEGRRDEIQGRREGPCGATCGDGQPEADHSGGRDRADRGARRRDRGVAAPLTAATGPIAARD